MNTIDFSAIRPFINKYKEIKMKSKVYTEQINEGLLLSGPEDFTGDHEAYIATNSQSKYYVKTNYNPHSKISDPQFSYYLEVLAARFYSFAATKTITAETTFFVRGDGSINLASKWVENFVPYAISGLPYISGNKIVVKIEGEEKEVHGYLEMLLVAKWINNYDCIGKGVNAGYIIAEDGEVYNVKIDPGGAFSFVNNQLFNVIFGPVLHINQKMVKKYLEVHRDDPDFYTDIPLEMLDNYNPLHLNDRFIEINLILNNYYQDIDTRDLLIDNLRYQDIIKSPYLRNILASTVYKIITTTDFELRFLVYEDMPNIINAEDIDSVKESVLNAMILRREKIFQLYQEEVEFYYSSESISIRLQPEILSPLISAEEARDTALKSKKILESLIDKIDNDSTSGERDITSFKTSQEYVAYYMSRCKAYEEKVESRSLCPNEEMVIQFIADRNLGTAAAIMMNYPKIACQIKENIIPEELKDFVQSVKEDYIRFLYGSDDEDSDYEDSDYKEIPKLQAKDPGYVDSVEEIVALIRYVNHNLLNLFENILSYDFSDLENHFVTELLEQISELLSIETISIGSLPIHFTKFNSYGLPDDDGDDHHSGGSGSGAGFIDYGDPGSYMHQVPLGLGSSGTNVTDI